MIMKSNRFMNRTLEVVRPEDGDERCRGNESELID